MSENKRIVVIGNGAAGSQFTAKMAKVKDFNITVITPFNYSEISVNMTKVFAVGPEEHVRSIYPLLKEDGVEYIVDECAEVSNDSVTLKSGRIVPFDCCVIASGQNIPLFYADLKHTSMELRKNAIQSFCSRLSSSNNIVIAGGGPIGSELAADIKLRNKSKSVTLVHSREKVLSGMHEPFQELATKHLEKLGINLFLSDRVVSHKNNEVELSSGKRISCDLFIPCHASGGNSSFMPIGCVDERGYIKVDDTFKVQLLNNVFAFGDCSNYDTVKTYSKIYEQLVTLKFNVKATLKGTPLKHHIRGSSFMGQFSGPVMVALGHGHEEGYGVGPDCPGWWGSLCWLCPGLSGPCSYPAGAKVAKAKSNFNNSIQPRKGSGFSG